MKPYLPPLIVVGIVCVAGCRQDMAAQPRYNPLSSSTFFDEEGLGDRSARPLEPGTVPRGQARLDPIFFEGQRVYHLWGLEFTSEVTTIPLPVNMELLQLGQERFNVMCSACHDRVGTGNGKVVQRGYLRPPSYHSDRVRAFPVGHIFQVITRGQGGMPALSDQVTPRDRWAIVAYIQALQLSQHFDKPLTKEERDEWLKYADAHKPSEGDKHMEGHQP
jgi:hypothetical protein